jgi:hypothetical protein
MFRRPTVYIGSSNESLPYAVAIQANLAPYAESTVWNQGVFPPNDSTLEALDRAIARFGFEYAILVLTPDDQRDFRGKPQLVPRDNVLMELGLFMGRLGRKHTFAVHHPDAQLPANLYGIATCQIEKRQVLNHRASVAGACEEIRRAIEDIEGKRKEAEQKRADDEAKQTLAPILPPESFGQNLRGYANVSESGFVEKTLKLVETSSEITFVGTGLNVLEQAGIRERIVRRVREGKLKATICFGNPFSPAVRHRLVEEERSDSKPSVAAQGIINRVKALLHSACGLPGLEVRLFNNYPTMSVFRFDSKHFVFYPMGYRKLGNHCPVITIEPPGALGDYLNEMIDKYLEDAVDAREVFRVRVDHNHSLAFVNPDQLRAVAVYVIPDRESEFYKIGSELLGYDVLNDRKELPEDRATTPFRAHVGGARHYGFHVSASDVMYLDVRQIPALMCELREIAVGAHPFDLTVLKVAEGEFGPNSVALACEEPSGHLERLLAEITVRLRPMGLGTNYTLDPARVRHWGELTSRDKTMMEAYQSPYVFSRFQPHFTLASPQCPPNQRDRERLKAIATKRFEKYLTGGVRVPINRLYLLERPVGQEYWNPVSNDNIIWLH